MSNSFQVLYWSAEVRALSDVLRSISFLALLLALTSFALLALHNHIRASQSLPPGPPRLPIIGNLHQWPKAKPWLTFKQWGEMYGDVCSVVVLGSPVIILNSYKAVSDILERKAATSSGRPRMVMANELCGHENQPGMTNDMHKHKQWRKLFQQALNVRACQAYWPIQLREVRNMVCGLIDSPNDLESHIKRAVTAIIFLVSHGYQIEDDDDYFINLGNEVFVNFAKAATPGAYMVDYLPFLRYIPAWFPGAGFKREAAAWKAQLEELAHKPFNMVKAQMAAGVARPSVTSRLLEQQNHPSSADTATEDLVMWCGAAIYGAGAETSFSIVQAFYYAMMLYPAVQAKAQAEIDEVVGRDRMPDFGDRDRLVYCSAIVKETLRWHPTAPLGVPHTFTEDETYEGYRLPRGSIILPNIWAILHDPIVYPSPNEFRPERFLSEDDRPLCSLRGARDSSTAAFGFGRRVCPGSNLAEDTLYISVVTTLWAFRISKRIGPSGESIEPDLECEPGAIHHFKKFNGTITLRSSALAQVVQAYRDASDK